MRLGINQAWQSCWFAPKKEQGNWLQQDKLIRNYLFTRFPEITQIKIERTETELVIFVRSPNTSLITGESDDSVDIILAKITQIANDQKIVIKPKLYLEKDNFSAQKVANDLAQELKNRVHSRSALRVRALQEESRDFVVRIKGIIDGVEMAQIKKNSRGRMSSATLDSLIEEGRAEASVERGQIGVSVLIYRGKRKKTKYVNFNT